MKKTLLRAGLVSSVLSAGLCASDLSQIVSESKVTGSLTLAYLTAHGDNTGQRYFLRGRSDWTSGAVDGYSITSGLYYQSGGGFLNGAVSDTSVSGIAYSRSVSMIEGFGVPQFFLSKQLSSGGDGTFFRTSKLDVGVMNIKTVFTSGLFDRGLGLRFTGDDGSFKYHISFYDSWASLAIYANMFQRDAACENMVCGLGNNLSIIGVESSGNPKQDGMHLKFWYANVANFIPYMLHFNTLYVMGQSSLTFQLGVASPGGKVSLAAGGCDKAKTCAGSLKTQNEFYAKDDVDFKWTQSRLRGVANFNFAHNLGSLAFKLGFLQSFGDGYGVSLQGGGFDVANSYYNSYSPAPNGFSFLGAGSKKGSSINVIYVGVSGGISPKLKYNVGISRVGGKNNLFVLSKPDKRYKKEYTNPFGKKGQGFKNMSMIDITSQLNYSLGKNSSFSAKYSYVLGDMNMGALSFILSHKI